MTLKMTKRTQEVINKCFPKNNVIAASLIKEYEKTEKVSERILFAIIKLSKGDVDKLESVIKTAKIDWRDILVLADFANDLNAHNDWVNSFLSGRNTFTLS